MRLQKLPIGIQTFTNIRQEDYLYIDKTGLALKLIEKYNYVFLSRPRRFGKSLFLDTLKNIFAGKQELFKGLAIEHQWDWTVKYPVIVINFTEGKIKSKQQLEDKWEEIFTRNQQKLGVNCKYAANDRRCFSELIRKAYKKYQQKVVVLVDEYDKPILDNISDLNTASDIRDALVDFYSVIKGSDAYLRFAFLTGVSKFTKTSLFSGLNNLVDISLDKEFGDICGYTQADLDTSFTPYLSGVDKEELKNWYNGYNFLNSSLYNPFDVLQFISKGHTYGNYWFETGTPSFLIQLIKQKNYFLPDLTRIKADNSLLSSFDIDRLDLEVILYQSGYLTIDTSKTSIFGTQEYTLKLPNKEVKHSFNDYIIDYLIQDPRRITNKTNIYKSLLAKDMQGFKAALMSMFASIPYNNFTKSNLHHYEGFYASIIYVYLQSLGVHLVGEDVTNKGRIDLTLKLKEVIYILEFKVENQVATKANALEQIKRQGYANKYLNLNKDIYLIGIHFNKTEKNISRLDWEKL